MKKILSAIFAVTAFLSLASCETDTETKVVETPYLTLSPSSLTLTAEAVPTYTINYTVGNPADYATVALTSDASWLSNLDASVDGQLKFSVAENPTNDLRTGTLTATYSYADGAVTAKAAVVQYGVGSTVLVVDPTAITADADGGTYSFYCSVQNGEMEGGVSCTANVNWISSFDYSADGTVSFAVAASSADELRSGTITVKCDDLEAEVTVVQDFPEKWTLYGTGDWEYTAFFEGTDQGLELYQSDSNKNKFKIEHWCYDVDFVFTWNQDTNEVVARDQSIGYTYGSYGLVYVDDTADYYGSGIGYHTDGVFYFSLVYYAPNLGTYSVGCETFTLDTATTPAPSAPSLEDVCGTYMIDGFSTYGILYNQSEDWTFEASDDSTKGDIMLTNYNGWENTENPIYGTYDSETGLITIDTGTAGVYFGTYSFTTTGPVTYDFYFLSYIAYYYSGVYGTELYMTVLPNGSVMGPLYGDLMCEMIYSNNTPYGWNQAFECVCGAKQEAAGPTSLSTSARKVSEKGVKAISDKFDRTFVNTSKIPFTKPAK